MTFFRALESNCAREQLRLVLALSCLLMRARAHPATEREYCNTIFGCVRRCRMHGRGRR